MTEKDIKNRAIAIAQNMGDQLYINEQDIARAVRDICKLVAEAVSDAKASVGWNELTCVTMEPGSPEWKARRAQILTDESGKPLRWYYLSLADDERFYGAVIVEASGPVHALQLTHKLGINPGGQALVFAVPEDKPVPDGAKNRLLSTAEIEALLGPVKQPYRDQPVGGKA